MTLDGEMERLEYDYPKALVRAILLKLQTERLLDQLDIGALQAAGIMESFSGIVELLLTSHNWHYPSLLVIEKRLRKVL